MAYTPEQKSRMILSQNPIWKGLLTLAFPVFLANILKMLHDVVDGFFLGRVPDVDGVSLSTNMQAAVGITWPVFFIFISLGIGLTVAGNALIGQYVGKKDMVGAKKYASNTVRVALAMGLIFNLILALGAETIIRWIGAEGMVFTYAVTYLRIRSFELPFLFLSFAYQAVRQSTGDTTTPVLVSATAIIINIILTPIMILGWNLGIAGAGLSTLVANICMLPLMLYFFIRPKNGLKIALNKSTYDLEDIKHLIKIALPSSVGQAIQALGFVIINAIILREYAEAVSAAFFIGNRLNSIILMPVSSISSVLAIFISQNIGAGNVARAKASFRSGMFLAVTLMTLGAALIIPFRFVLVELFNSNPETILYAAEYTLFLHLGLPFMGVFQTYLSTYQGSGDTKFAFFYAVTRLWVIRLPLIWLAMTFTDFGPAGVWYAILISNALMIFVGMFLYNKIDFLPKIRVKHPAAPAEEAESMV